MNTTQKWSLWDRITGRKRAYERKRQQALRGSASSAYLTQSERNRLFNNLRRGRSRSR